MCEVIFSKMNQDCFVQIAANYMLLLINHNQNQLRL